MSFPLNSHHSKFSLENKYLAFLLNDSIHMVNSFVGLKVQQSSEFLGGGGASASFSILIFMPVGLGLRFLCQ